MTSDETPGSSERKRSRAKNGVCFESERTDETRRVRLANDVDLPLEEFITVGESDGYEYTDALPAYELPGSGERLASCGDDVPALFCPICGTPETVGRTCRRSSCPRCWQSWVYQRARTLAAKVESLGRHEYAQNDRAVKQHHLVVSFRDSTRVRSTDPHKQATTIAKLLLQRVNVETGYLVYHPYRIAPAYRGHERGHTPGNGTMTWPDILALIERDEWSWPAVREKFLVYGPHFHVIGLSEFVSTEEQTAALEEQTGIVLHRITTRRHDGTDRSITDVTELCRIAVDTLSHAGIESTDDGVHYAAFRPFGKVANFSAYGDAAADVTAALREVAPSILGLRFSEHTCTEPLDMPTNGDHEEKRCSMTAADSSVKSGDTLEADTSPTEESICGGSSQSMHVAHQYLDNPAWIAWFKNTYDDAEKRLTALERASGVWDELDRSTEAEPGECYPALR